MLNFRVELLHLIKSDCQKLEESLNEKMMECSTFFLKNTKDVILLDARIQS